VSDSGPAAPVDDPRLLAMCSDGRRPALQFPGDRTGAFSGYVYFAVGVATTLGVTDVSPAPDRTRRDAIQHGRNWAQFLSEPVTDRAQFECEQPGPVATRSTARPPRPGHHKPDGAARFPGIR